jgi:hypothetical protein
VTSYRTKDGVWKIIDGELYRRTNQNGKTGVWIHVSGSPDELSKRLMLILMEVLDEGRRPSSSDEGGR